MYSLSQEQCWCCNYYPKQHLSTAAVWHTGHATFDYLLIVTYVVSTLPFYLYLTISYWYFLLSTIAGAVWYYKYNIPSSNTLLIC